MPTCDDLIRATFVDDEETLRTQSRELHENARARFLRRHSDDLHRAENHVLNYDLRKSSLSGKIPQFGTYRTCFRQVVLQICLAGKWALRDTLGNSGCCQGIRHATVNQPSDGEARPLW